MFTASIMARTAAVRQTGPSVFLQAIGHGQHSNHLFARLDLALQLTHPWLLGECRRAAFLPCQLGFAVGDTKPSRQWYNVCSSMP